jgi:hypothetical protein
MCQPVLFTLMCVRNRDTFELVAVVFDDILLEVSHHDDEFVRTLLGELFETVRENGFPVDLDHSFGFVFRERTESCPLTGREHHSLHNYLNGGKRP